MKKIFPFLVALCSLISALSSNAQTASTYAFSQTSGTYTSISGATNIFTGSWDDNMSNGLSIGFTFNYCGTNYTTFNINANGWINFGSSTSTSYTPVSARTDAVSPFGVDLYYASSGTVSYVVTGSSPNRICTIQWLNCCHYSSSTTGPLNFQINLYEGTNVVEFVYGSCSPSSTTSYSQQVGISGNSNSDFNNRTTTSNWSSTTAGGSNTATCTQSNTIVPASGLTFRWTPPCTLPSISVPTTPCVGSSVTLSDPTTGGAWTSSNTAVATISSSGGSLTGISTGTSIIDYTIGSCFATTVITVNPSPVVTVSASPSTICAGSTSSLNSSATNPGANYTVSSISYSLASQTSPTTVTFSSYDDGTTAVSIPFSFSYYGSSYSSVNIGTNGYVQLGGASTTYSVASFPTSALPGAIALFWCDLDVISPGAITYSTEGSAPNRKFVIKYSQVAPCCSYADSYDGEVILYETTNVIDILVSNAVSGTHTCGIQNVAGTTFVTPSGRNGASYAVTTPEAWRFAMAAPTFSWVADPTLSSTTIANPTTSALSSTHVYTALATGTNGCVGSSSISVTVSPAPTPLTGTTTICQTGTTTLSSSTGGTWASSNTGVASVVTGSSSTGIVTGVAQGSATITYAFGASCIVTQAVTVLATAPVTGPSTVCPGLTINMSDALATGTWTSSNTTFATVIPSTGVVTGVSAGSPNIIYTLPNGCARNATITVNPLPATFTGATTVCQGLTSTITETSVGGVWSIGTTTIASIGTASATTAVLSGTSAGTTTLTYTLPTSCIMTAPVLVNPLPVPITSPAGSCVTNAVNPTVTLVDGTPLGSWSVSNPLLASIVSFSGQITGSSAGPLTVTYTLPTGCIATTGYIIYPLPTTISGSLVVCSNASTYLSDGLAGGTWLSSNALLATVGSGSGLVTGVSSGNPVMSYTLPTGCLAIATMLVNPAPGTIVGASSVCVNSSTPLSVGGLGTWSSSSPGLASVTPGPGAGGGTVSGLIPGNPVITYTLPGTGCFNTQSMTVNPIPSAITPAGAGVCVGNTTTLNDATLGGTWSSAVPGTAPVSTVGVVSTIGAPGVPTPVTISYALSTGCQVTTQVTVNPLPTAFGVSPAGPNSYCASGGGIDIKMTTTDPAIQYQLSVGRVPFPTALPGTGSVLDFGSQTVAGTYSVIGINAATGCSNAMTGNPVISINPLPTLYTVGFTGSPTSNYCDVPGAAGVDITLSGSQTKVGYILNVDGVFAGLTFGTGTTLDLLPQSTTGNYTVIAQDSITLCQSNMVGSVTVGKFALPTPQDVTIQDLGLSTGAGSYCASGPGVHIGLNFASTGINYQLWDTTNTPWTLVNTVAGANSSLDFGYQQAVVGTPHVFAVVGVNPLTSCTNNMNNYVTVTADPLPTPYVLAAPGGSSYCLGGNGDTIRVISSDNGIHYQLYNGGTAVGSPVAGTTFAIDFLNIISKGAYTVVGTDDLTGCTNAMTGSVNVNTYPAIAPYDVMVNGSATGDSYCSGAGGLHVTLNKSDFNVTYYLYYNGVSMNDSLYGSSTKLDFGADTGAGVYTVIGRSTLYNCTATMNNNPAIAINSLPIVYPETVTNGGYYCAGGTGVNIGISFSDVGIDYQLYKGAITKTGSPVAGSGAAVDFGTFTTPGTYTIIGTNRLTSCTSNMSGSANVTINALPAVYTVTGGGGYCAGSPTGIAVGLTNSGTGIHYQLFNSGAQIGAFVTGTGTTISFGSQTATGLYTVVATDAASGCTQNMAGSRVITINPLPNVYAVTGGGTYCAGSTAAHVMLGNSTTGIQYQLFNGITPVGTLPGSGSAIDFGPQGTSGGYTVTASNSITGCSSNMSGIATVMVNPLPAVQTVSGGGGYCAGTSGAHIYLTTGSQPGISYQPYIGLVAQGSPVTGTGVVLDLGPQTTAGSYTVIASDAGTGCSMKMTGSATVSINALPSAYTVSGGGTLCAGAAGYDIIQTGSATGISYQLFNSATPGASVKTMIGTGALLDFGVETNAGTYTVVATNSTTGCVNNMAGSGNIHVNPAPDPFTVTGGGHFCAGTLGVAVGLTGSVAGVNYQLYNGLLPIGLPVGGTGTILNFGPQTTPGTYTIIGTNTMTTCTGSMTGNTPVVADPTVKPTISITGTDGIACIGQSVNYTTSVINGGTAPTYIWKVGAGIVSGGSSYSGIPASGDVVSVSMTSSANCASPATVTTSVKMSVMPYVTPSATISADPGNSVCSGTPVTFTASTVSGGTAPGYSWLVNGVVLTTASSTTYNYTPVDGDAVVFMLRSSERCRTADSVFSSPIAMNVDEVAAPGVTVASHLGPVVNVGQVDTFIVTLSKKVPGASYTYQWFINGSVVTGEDRAIFINHDVFNNDNISVIVTKNGACGDQSGTAQVAVVLHNLGAGNVTTTTSDIAVLPNPSKGEFNVKGTLGTSNSEEVTLEITNMLGQEVYNGKVMAQNGNINEHISLENTIANGMYLLSVHSESVSTVFHIVIEK